MYFIEEHVPQGNLEPMTRRREFILTLEGRFKGLPIHSACGYGRIEAVKKLVEWEKFHQIPNFLEEESVQPQLPAFTKTTELKTMTKVLRNLSHLCDGLFQSQYHFCFDFDCRCKNMSIGKGLNP